MNHRKPTPSVLVVAFCNALLLLTPVLAFPSCAAARVARFQPGGGAGELERLAEVQRSRPVASLRDVAPPPHVDDEALAPIDPNDREAQRLAGMGLDEVLEALLADASDAPYEPVEVSDRDREDALRLYVSGREKLNEGDAAEAERDLFAATQKDPNSPELWRELGEALLAQRKRSAAVRAFERAIERGLDEPRAYFLIAQANASRLRHASAAEYLARALEAGATIEDPALENLIDVELGRSLVELGYLSAGIDAIERGLDLPEAFASATAYRAELIALLREQGESWRAAGDAAVRLADYERASDAYARALEYATTDPAAVTTRMILVSMRRGMPAEGALTLVEEIRDARGLVDTRHVSLIQYVAQDEPTGRALADALDSLQQELGADLSPSVKSRIVRARAAAVPRADARRLLRSYLEQDAGDRAALSDLLATYDAHETREIAGEVARLAMTDPMAADRLAQALIDSVRRPSELPGVLSNAQPRNGAALISAHVLSELGQHEAAIGMLESVPSDEPFRTARLAAGVEFAARAGRIDEGERLLDELRGEESTDALLARARGEAAMSFPEAALATTQTIVEDGELGRRERVRLMLVVASFQNRLGLHGEAAETLRAALDIDPYDERIFGGLLALYHPTGALADEAELTEIVRELRQTVPSSRVLRWVNAQELFHRGMFARAEPELIGLAEEDLSDEDVIRLLVGSWVQAGSLDGGETLARGERWLRSKLEVRPESLALKIGLARVLATGGQPEEASELLASVRSTGSTEAARLHERIVREDLGRPEEADAMALERLTDGPPTRENLVELATMLARAERFEEAADAIKRLEQQGGVPPELTQIIVQMAASFTQRAIQSGDASDRRAALNLFDTAVRLNVRMPPELHLARVALLSLTSDDFDAQRLADATFQAVAQHPEMTPDVYVRPALAIQGQGRHEDLVEFVSRASRAGVLEMYAFWAQTLATEMTVDEVEAFIDLVFEEGRSDEAHQGVYFLLGIERQETLPFDENTAKAEMAYLIGANLFQALRTPDDTNEIYRLALRYNPRHGMAANNLGYDLADRNVDIEEADRLLEIAFEVHPEESSVVDSIGWVRYKQGVIEDEVDEQGEVVRQGAVTLLQRAVDLAEEARPALPYRHRATLQDHLGDALFRAGRNEDASTAWNQAIAHMNDYRQVAARANRDDELKQASARIGEIEKKQRALMNGEPPKVAPLAPGVQEP